MAESESQKVVAQQRVTEFLEGLVSTGTNHRTIGSLLDVPVQYLSDYKQGRRFVSEAIARRFEEHFGVNAQWLLAESDLKEALSPPKLTPASDVTAFKLPIFSHPIEGDPQAHPQWEGMFGEVLGVAAVKLRVAKHPYLLLFGADDAQGRVARGNLLLMSQATLPPNAAMESVIQVIRHGRGLYLARRKANAWHRLATAHSEPIAENCTVHGHVMGIVWADLT